MEEKTAAREGGNVTDGRASEDGAAARQAAKVRPDGKSGTFAPAGRHSTGASGWRVFLALLLAYALFAILLNSVGTVILQSIRYFGVAKTTASTLEAFKDLSIAGVSFLVAAFLARFGYRRAMVIALAVVAAALFAMPLVDRFAMAQLLFLATGASFAVIKVSTYATLGLLSANPRDHQFRMNLLEGVFMLGVLAGYWIFGHFMGDSSADDPAWMDVYPWLGGAALAAAALLLVTPFPSRSPDPHKTRRAAPMAVHTAFGEMWRLAIRPLTLVFVVSAFLYVLIEQAIGTWLPTFNREILSISARTSVEVTSIFAAALATGRIGASVLLRRVRWYPLLIAALALMAGLILFVLPLAGELAQHDGARPFGLPIAAFLLPLIGLFMAPVYPAINSAVLSSLPTDRQAAMTGLIVVFSALGGTTGSLITGFLFAHLNGIVAFYGTLVPISGLAIALTVFRRLLRDDHWEDE